MWLSHVRSWSTITPRIFIFSEFWIKEILFPSSILMFIFSWFFRLRPKITTSVLEGLIFKLFFKYQPWASLIVSSIFSWSSSTVFAVTRIWVSSAYAFTLQSFRDVWKSVPRSILEGHQLLFLSLLTYNHLDSLSVRDQTDKSETMSVQFFRHLESRACWAAGHGRECQRPCLNLLIQGRLGFHCLFLQRYDLLIRRGMLWWNEIFYKHAVLGRISDRFPYNTIQ